MSDSVLVTGASTGLGLETAVYLAERGFRVYATMRELGRRHALDEEASRRGVELDVTRLDITDKNDIETAVRRIVEQSGGIYGLVNNAGIGLRGFFEDQSDDEIRQVFETNVFGTMAVTRAVLPHMREKGRGRIIIVTSVGGRMGMLGVSSYCATKFAQEGFGEALAQEVRPLGIHVSLIAPAIIKTERWSINRGVARRALSPESPYHTWFKKSERLADWAVETSPTKPVEVASVVHRVLAARRPRLRYMVGRRANRLFKIRRYVPGEWFDRLYVGEVLRRVTKAGNAG